MVCGAVARKSSQVVGVSRNPDESVGYSRQRQGEDLGESGLRGDDSFPDVHLEAGGPPHHHGSLAHELGCRKSVPDALMEGKNQSGPPRGLGTGYRPADRPDEVDLEERQPIRSLEFIRDDAVKHRTLGNAIRVDSCGYEGLLGDGADVCLGAWSHVA